MQTKKQAGFTLIELMIVVAIVGILAAVAIPAYQDYIKRSKVSEVAATLAACKTSVAEFAASQNALPTTTDESGCDAGDSTYVSSLSVGAGGVIQATIQSVDSTLDGNTLNLAPYADVGLTTAAVDGDDIKAWKCSTSAASTEYKYLPANCRQAP
ncbi:prepilin-type cleavage/methylation domain-containing protein [Kangiella profundi]|uniref:Prepilin-type cleavage/methylation domain-containing protein n=1 Tax=Kangiella profundi TaxID=1561924 RepID=A0A2K9AKY5_9GAMM|nr:pilin [Kangiella profundi]AUD78302.1 prepilin-type cleavage/methylation domain-containing protein [Kangiella profundi]GGF06936.1 pilin [Kangiella profundi]